MTKERLARITIDDAQCGGRPCIRGMRIRVTDILELLSAGATMLLNSTIVLLPKIRSVA